MTDSCEVEKFVKNLKTVFNAMYGLSTHPT